MSALWCCALHQCKHLTIKCKPEQVRALHFSNLTCALVLRSCTLSGQIIVTSDVLSTTDIIYQDMSLLQSYMVTAAQHSGTSDHSTQQCCFCSLFCSCG
eukprot:9885-Heterococcus_DN1.PRE.1